MSSAPNTRLCVVYSMGRAGSRSLYEELKQLGFVCKHTHFLSDEGLKKRVEALTTAGLGEIEIQHWTGQLVDNLDTRRRLETYRLRRQGPEPAIITTMRDPSTWFLSNMVQNWPGISAHLRRHFANSAADDLELAAGLYSRMEKALDYVATLRLGSTEGVRKSVNVIPDQLDRMLLNMILDPLLWLEEEYCRFTGVPMDELRGIGPTGKTIKIKYGLSIVGRVEDMPELRHTISSLVGVELSAREGMRRNVSREAPASGAITKIFGQFHERLRAHPVLRESTYRQLFQY